MFDGMGIQWAGTLLGCVAVALVPIPIGFMLYGRKLRERSKFSPTFAEKAPPEESTDEEDGMAPVAKERTDALGAAPTRTITNI